MYQVRVLDAGEARQQLCELQFLLSGSTIAAASEPLVCTLADTMLSCFLVHGQLVISVTGSLTQCLKSICALGGFAINA